MLGRALVLAGDTLFMAGPPDVVDEEQTLVEFNSPNTAEHLAEQEAAYAGKQGAVLLAVSAADGKQRAAYRLASMPVFDGMAAACGRLFLATTDGRVIALGAAGQPLEAAAGIRLTSAEQSKSTAAARTHPDFARLEQVEVGRL